MYLLFSLKRPVFALEFAHHKKAILWCLFCEVIYCTFVHGFSFLIYLEGIVCALINVCASVSSLCAYISVVMHAGVVRWSDWYGAEVTGILSPGQMGRDAFAQEVAE